MDEILPEEVTCIPGMESEQLKNPFRTFIKKYKKREVSRLIRRRKKERTAFKKLVKKLESKKNFYKKKLNNLKIEIFLLKEEIYVNSII